MLQNIHEWWRENSKACVAKAAEPLQGGRSKADG